MMILRRASWMWFAALSLFMLAAACTNPRAADRPQVIPATVISVVDGDTAYMRIGRWIESVRFIGVDAPELSHPSLGIREEPYAWDAWAYTCRNLSWIVWLELDVVPRDQYGRLLAYIWLLRPASASESEVRAKMLNARLLAEGYAQVMTIPPNVKYSQVFLKLQEEARAKKVGLWGTSPAGPEAPPDTSVAPYIGNRNSGKFHRASCYYVTLMNPDNKVPFWTREEALAAGYVPCKVCRP